jgi:hypothetical protein
VGIASVESSEKIGIRKKKGSKAPRTDRQRPLSVLSHMERGPKDDLMCGVLGFLKKRKEQKKPLRGKHVQPFRRTICTLH